MAKSRVNPTFSSIFLLVAVGLIWFLGKPSAAVKEPAPSPAISEEKSAGGYEVFHGCIWVNDRGNDGDSFRVRFPTGREEIIRLFFVDTPESAFKFYGAGRSNHQRIVEQARALGGISPEQAVEIGKKSKSYAQSLLGKTPFTVYTRWQDPFGDRRYSAFVQTQIDGKSQFYHEALVKKGLARIHTRGADLPDGSSMRKHRNDLFELQRVAQSQKVGAWEFSSELAR